MTTRSPVPTLPLEVRRAIWQRLWREVLLRPRQDVLPTLEDWPHEIGAGDKGTPAGSA